MARLFMPNTPVRDCFSNALMDLCAQRELGSITVACLAQHTGLTRQTFYNHFSNIDDLVYYAGSRHLITGEQSIVLKPSAIRKTYLYTFEHRDFFMQLSGQSGPSSYQEAAVRWLKRKGYESFIREELSGAERLHRRTQIDLFQSGSAHVMFDWVARGMREPVDSVVGAVCDMLPGFMRNESYHVVAIDYPK